MALRKAAVLFALAFGSYSQPIDECPIFGSSFPAGFNISNTKAFSKARSAFPKAIEKQFSAGLLNKTHTVFAIDVFSTATNESVYSYFHTGEALKGSVTGGELNDTTVSRVGSVTKLFTAYAVLAAGGIGVLEHPVTKYLPELAGNNKSDPLDKLHWEDVTIGALMSQQGGSGGVPAEVIQKCPGTPGNCSIPDFLKLMRNEKRPTMPPFQRPLYSDGGWAILGRVLERLTKLPLNDALQKTLSKPLGLDYTAYMKPPKNHSNTIVLPGDLSKSSWGYDNQVIASSGGIYTSAADLRTVGLSILNSKLLPASTTRRWMHPLGSTSSLTFNVGAPWEIHRLAVPVTPGSNRTRIMDLYTKLGANAGYSSCIALSPDHGLGFSLMSVGPTAGVDRVTLRDLIGDVFLPAAEHAGAENAVANFAGTFADEKEPGTNVTLTVDKGRPGLGVAEFFISDMDVRGNVSTSPPPPGSKFAVRIYGTGGSSPDNLPSALYRTRGTVRYGFRAVLEDLPYEKHNAARGGKSLFMNECLSWFSVGFSQNIDEFVLEMVDGELKSVEYPLTKTVMKKVK
ncbi:beta-lactamase [Purpureocillium lavendulum]|uniref:Beta-lactamase n=1 Tax=Purpureocillium lavendulum TaxID=1247861 RepID=A0AB34GA27_9HYPO|nr:beta-lactamase [Purpureocillium lavendulum]